MTFSAVRTRRTEQNNAESAEGFLLDREAVVRFVHSSIAYDMDRQIRRADKNERANEHIFVEGDLVLISRVNPPRHVVTNVGSSKLLPTYIGPFRVLRRQGTAYTIELPSRMRTLPTFYVGRLRPYCQYDPSSDDKDSPHVQEPPSGSCAHAPYGQSRCVLKRSLHSTERSPRETSPAPQRGSGHRARPEAARPRDLNGPSHARYCGACGASAQNLSKRNACTFRA